MPYSPLMASELRSTALEEVPQQARSLHTAVPHMAWLEVRVVVPQMAFVPQRARLVSTFTFPELST